MKIQKGTVFEFTIYYEGDIEFLQKRYVFAKTEEEAVMKFDAYNKQQMKKGFARMIAIGVPTVDNDGVIA